VYRPHCVWSVLTTSVKILPDRPPARLIRGKKSAVARSNTEVNKLKEDFNNQCKYVASLEEELARVSKKVKTQKEELDDLRVSFDELEQYTRKNSLELHGIPEDIDLPMAEIVCKVAEAIGVELECDDVEIAHRLNRKKGIKPIIAKFVSHKDKSRLYKARVQLKDSTVPSVFPNYAGPITTDPPMRIFINENLTQYRKEMMSLALQKKNDQKITNAWSLDGKIFVKTSPSGQPRRMYSKEDIKEGIELSLSEHGQAKISIKSLFDKGG